MLIKRLEKGGRVAPGILSALHSFLEVKSSISDAAGPRDVRLIAVSKFIPADVIRTAHDAGQAFGACHCVKWNPEEPGNRKKFQVDPSGDFLGASLPWPLFFHQMNECPKKNCRILPCTLYIMASNSQVDFGENYVQELLDKAAELPNSIRLDDVGWGPHLDLHIRTHHRAHRVHDSVFDSQPGFEPE